ncbi:hypothetical protein Acr_21g0010260 [Actinidia rufa]|uniref:Uncharacterized protein n=1 Tax=Actinidia rufa TaxID=165716 RepID=A0A7J0GHZ5_9ERIC|nr:hypothetical protein Acr_21g0010260 [Actinidia rufa]
MAHIVRPLSLRHWPRHHHRCFRSTLHYLLHSPSVLATVTTRRFSFTASPSSHRNLHFRSRGLKLPNAPTPSDFRESERDGSDSDTNKNRNEKKREARRAVQWGMELANFSADQIKRILRVFSLESEVLDAILLVKGSHNYIDRANRWFDGLINKDVDITKEIYSVQDVDLDRQKLRRLVREVHSIQERQVTVEENEGSEDAALMGAKRSLARFSSNPCKAVTK